MNAATVRHFMRTSDPVVRSGRLSRVGGLLLEATGPHAALGELCRVVCRGGDLPAEVVGLDGSRTLLAPLGDVPPLVPGAEVVASGRPLLIACGPDMLGRVLDPLGRPLDGAEPWLADAWVPLDQAPPAAMERGAITRPFRTGVRVIDGFLTIGGGQRVGLFAGSGVGKSTLLGMLARHSQSPVVVLGLVGERGREVAEFLDHSLGPDGRKRCVTVVATSDQPALLRIKAAQVATRIAEYFRDRGQDVLLLLDSLTRVAMAQREVGLALGEPAAGRGYPPSVFALLPRLLERAGPSARGSITAFYTVLVEADDMADPVADAARSWLDGHVVLSRALAERGHYPAVDVLASQSRLFERVAAPGVQQAAIFLRRLMAAHRDALDLIRIGAYREGSDPQVDRYRQQEAAIEGFLRQGIAEASSLEETWQALRGLAA